MRYKTWQEFFANHDTSYIGLDSYGGGTHVCLEDLYQHFKARLVEELVVKSPELLSPAELIDTRPTE